MPTTKIGRTATFAHAAPCYWLEIFPFARRELRDWARRAEAIAEPGLRRDALLALQDKGGNAEGLAAFAVLAPRPGRRAAVRAAVAYQTILDYLDTVTERPNQPRAEKLRLNSALEVAVDSELSLETYREETAQRNDAKYLTALVVACRDSLSGLPSYETARNTLRQRARLGAESQTMNHSLLLGTEEAEIARWAQTAAQASSLEGELHWWEVVAAAASTPAFGAIAALAAKPGVTEAEFLAAETAYFPWVNLLNTLLDSLVDLDEDPTQQRHIERYDSPQMAAKRLAVIALRARTGVRELPNAERHELILAAMGGYYLAEPAAWLGVRRDIGAAVRESLGPFARPTLFVHKLRRGKSRTMVPARHGRRWAEALAR